MKFYKMIEDFFINTLFGISGKTLDKVNRVVG